MYFPDDPLFFQDPIFNSVRDDRAARADDRALRPTTPPRSSGRSPSAGTSCCAGAEATPIGGARTLSRWTTPSQTVGPYLAIGLPWPDGPTSCRAGTPGRASASRHACSTARATPIPDALVETWQADPDGRFDHSDDPRGLPRLRAGFTARPADDDGGFEIFTVKPGRCRSATARRPRTSTSASSPAACSTACVTRIYFADERGQRGRPGAVAACPRRGGATLLAAAGRTARLPRSTSTSRASDETVFFEL